MWENNEYKIYMRENTVLDFEKVMLSSGECRNLLPMIFIGEQENDVAYYDCGGFTPLSRYNVDKTEDALFIMEKVLLIVGSVVEYLLNPAKVTLSTDTVFCNPETGEIKIAYVPQSEEQLSLRRNLLNLITQLKADIEDGYPIYLDKLAQIVYANNYHVRDLINRLGLLRRELFAESKSPN